MMHPFLIIVFPCRMSSPRSGGPVSNNEKTATRGAQEHEDDDDDDDDDEDDDKGYDNLIALHYKRREQPAYSGGAVQIASSTVITSPRMRPPSPPNPEINGHDAEEEEERGEDIHAVYDAQGASLTRLGRRSAITICKSVSPSPSPVTAAKKTSTCKTTIKKSQPVLPTDGKAKQPPIARNK